MQAISSVRVPPDLTDTDNPALSARTTIEWICSSEVLIIPKVRRKDTQEKISNVYGDTTMDGLGDRRRL